MSAFTRGCKPSLRQVLAVVHASLGFLSVVARWRLLGNQASQGSLSLHPSLEWCLEADWKKNADSLHIMDFLAVLGKTSHLSRDGITTHEG